MNSDIEIRNLSVSFITQEGESNAVKDLSTTFYQGKISGVIGESGSGKSVMGMSILGLLPNTAQISGECWYKGENLYRLPLKELRKFRGAQIGLIPQNPNASLDPVMKIKKQITEVIFAHSELKSRRERKLQAEQQANQLLIDFGFSNPDEISKQYSFQMSGGMNQRLVSALGLACCPEWIIADEPTKGLDAVLRNQVYRVLKDIFLKQHSSMIVIPHDSHLAQRLCDDLKVLYKGQIIEQGDTQKMMENPLHPYTKGLLDSMPSRGMNPIPEEDPEKKGKNGCPFYSRCLQAKEKCRSEKPYDISVPDGRKVRCFLYE